MKKFAMPSLLSQQFVTGIDLGSSKICCWIGMINKDDTVSIIGAGHAAARGIEGGNLVNISELEAQITAAVYEAERQSNVQVHQATLTLNGNFFHSDHQVLKTAIPEKGVTQGLLDDLWKRFSSRHQGFIPLQIIPLEFCVDDQDHIKDPRGISGETLWSYCHTIWTHQGRLRTLKECLNRCQIQLAGLRAAPYTSGLACLTQDEQELGTVIVDMGAQSTGLGFFFENQFVSCKTVGLGGSHITRDIAQGCETTLHHAEQMKVLYGAAFPTTDDHKETLSVVPLGSEEQVGQTPRAFLINIIQARVEEICQLMKAKIDEVCATHPSACQRIVLTGGTSQLPGIREMVAQLLERPVRVAKSFPLPGAPRVCGEFATVSGIFPHKPMIKRPHSTPTFSFALEQEQPSVWGKVRALFQKQR